MGKYSAPAVPSSVKIADFTGDLLLVTPKEHRQDVITSFKPQGTDVVVADIVVLDGDHAGTVEKDVFIFQGRLIGQTKSNVESGEPVLGRLSRGTAKAGQSPPYELTAPTAADEKIADKYLADNPPF